MTGVTVRVRALWAPGLLTAALLALLCLSGPALGSTSPPQQPDDIHINVTLLDRGQPTADNPKGTPIPGVRIIVETPEGEEVGDDVTNRKGIASVAVPGSGDYIVRLDTETLPEGTELSDPDDVTNTVNVLGFDTSVQFPIGLAERTGTALGTRILGLMLSGLKFGLIIALASLGLSLVFGTTGLTNFAHGELVTMGALFAFALNVGVGLHIAIAGALAVAAMAVVGYLQDAGFWRPLRKRGTGNIALMIVSIGVALFLRYLFQYIFGGDTEPYQQYVTQQPWEIGPVAIAPKSIVIDAIALVVLVLVSLAVAKTRLGKATRAVADNPPLAASSGINVNTIVAIVWIMGTALAGLSGVLLGLDQQVDFQMGFKILLLVFAAVTLGGLGTIWGAMAGSIIVGLLIELSTLVIPSELKYIGALLLLIVILLFRPQGIFGRAERVG
jgi:branched-chain amino acid transport system permease protein